MATAITARTTTLAQLIVQLIVETAPANQEKITTTASTTATVETATAITARTTTLAQLIAQILLAETATANQEKIIASARQTATVEITFATRMR